MADNYLEEETRPDKEELVDFLTTQTLLIQARGERPFSFDADLESIQSDINKKVSVIGDFDTSTAERFANIARLINAHDPLPFTPNLFSENLKDDTIPISYIYLKDLSLLNVHELLGRIHSWYRKLKLRGEKERLMNSYIVILEDLPKEITEDLLELLYAIRYIFPIDSDYPYFKILTRDPNDIVFREILKKSKLLEISFVTNDMVAFTRKCMQDIVAVAEA